MDRRLSEDIIDFIQAHIVSIWALELMLVMMNQPDREWSVDLLVRELRANNIQIAGLLENFRRSGLASETAPGTWRWAPSPDALALAKKLAAAHAVTPFAVIQAIAAVPDNRLRQFADAFRLRKD